MAANQNTRHPQPAAQLRSPKYTGERLLVSESTLAKWRCAGIGPAYVKISGGRVAYEDTEIERYVASRRVTTRDSGAAA